MIHGKTGRKFGDIKRVNCDQLRAQRSLEILSMASIAEIATYCAEARGF